MENIGDRIKKARVHAGLTQKQLGLRCGMADSAIRRYESGRGNPTVDTVQRIANALSILPGELLGSIPQPDRAYEDLCDTLNMAGLIIEPSGTGYGTGPEGDMYYIWHIDAENIEEDRVEFSFAELTQIVGAIKNDAENHKTRYIAQRLESELFWPGIKNKD